MSTTATPSPTKIMIIRHGEKPAVSDQPQAAMSKVKKGGTFPECEPPFGVVLCGIQDSNSLTVLGWQRAGALVRLFAPINNVFINPLLAKPTYLYAMGAEAGHSVRPIETITPLAEELSIQPNTDFARGEEKKLWDDAKGCSGVILICWEHQNIADIVSYIPSNAPAPLKWPGDRFDLVWVFDLDDASGRYKFTATTQQLLPGDKSQAEAVVEAAPEDVEVV